MQAPDQFSRYKSWLIWVKIIIPNINIMTDAYA